MDRTTHYYPFGLEFGDHLGTSNSISPNYKYSSQGQEKQTETGWSSYRWRNYDSAMGRFFNVDPLSEKYAYQSHYNFSENRVVDARELEGLEAKKVNKVSLPGNDPMEFAEFIMGGASSVRAAVANNVARTINVLTNDAVRNKYVVDEDGGLTLRIGVPKESFKEKAVNGAFDLATIGLAAFGGPEGVLMTQGGKAPALKAIEEIKDAAKAVNGNSKFSGKSQHLYEIFTTSNNNVVKTGVSGGKVSQAGKSYRATSQVNKINKAEGEDVVDSRIIKTEPAGPNARKNILEAEERNANKNRSTLDPRYHKRP
ncbi:RHS repeat-associated core domain-containing protein [Chryseobacterium rhizosphaerae]|uniref:RHS repeat-associated core domain-containing protein n=1 Tax=Chryseobacterium rhizosphaerae TaxID=395937 RepID=UPI001E29681A|nr:RHS repeat-associated core domain-containing protein [Chryseobacterium rhizosphaerae]